MSTFKELLKAEEAKAANWAKEADGFHALYVELVQEGFQQAGASYHSAKQYANKTFNYALLNKMLKVEF